MDIDKDIFCKVRMSLTVLFHAVEAAGLCLVTSVADAKREHRCWVEWGLLNGSARPMTSIWIDVFDAT